MRRGAGKGTPGGAGRELLAAGGRARPETHAKRELRRAEGLRLAGLHHDDMLRASVRGRQLVVRLAVLTCVGEGPEDGRQR